MSKKDKKGLSSEDDVQTIISMLPQIEKLLKKHRDAVNEYHKYRENGGNEIPGLEKHLGCCENTCGHCGNTKAKVCKEDSKEGSTKPEAAEEVAKAKNTKKKDK